MDNARLTHLLFTSLASPSRLPSPPDPRSSPPASVSPTSHSPALSSRTPPTPHPTHSPRDTATPAETCPQTHATPSYAPASFLLGDPHPTAIASRSTPAPPPAKPSAHPFHS